MLLKSPTRRWLSSEVQPDLILVCDDGYVSAHTALLAGSSSFLSSLLSAPSSLYCAGCISPRRLILAGVDVAAGRALIDLLYTGKASFDTKDVAMVLGVSEMLGLEFEQLDIINSRYNKVTSQIRLNPPDSDNTDSVHPRFNRNYKSSDHLNNYQDLEPVRTSPNTLESPRPSLNQSKVSVISSGLRNLFSSQPNLSRSSDRKSSLVRGERLSQDLLAEPLITFPTKKLPTKTPDISDNILDDEELSSSSSRLLKTPIKSHPQGIHSTTSPGQVMVPNAVLSEVMDMIPLESIKVEAEERPENASLSELLKEMDVTKTDDDDENSYPQMEGKEEDEEDVTKSDPVTSYLSMNNSRNYVCNDCDAGFTFIRSYNWHRSRCKGKTLGKVCPPSPSKKPSLPSTSNTTTQAMVVCKICQASVTGLKSHLSLVHFKTQLLEQFSSSPRKCKLCSKKFKSIHSLILHIGIHHGMVRKLSSNSKSILKRKIINSSSSITKLKVDPETPTKSKDSKEKNSLYKASLLKKKLANGPETYNAINISESNKQSPKKQVKLEEAFVDGRPGTSSTPTSSSGRKVPCGVCVKCQLPDCGSCPQCVGGGAKGVQKICVKKVCRNKIWSTE